MSEMSEHEPTPELTPTLAETARRRADLHHALVALERAISSPAIGRESDLTERQSGLYDEIGARAPRLTNKIERLRGEHPEMRDATVDLGAKLETTPVGEVWDLTEARDQLQRLLGRVVRHRQLGADLVWEAYNLDIGGIE